MDQTNHKAISRSAPDSTHVLKEEGGKQEGNAGKQRRGCHMVYEPTQPSEGGWIFRT